MQDIYYASLKGSKPIGWEPVIQGYPVEHETFHLKSLKRTFKFLTLTTFNYQSSSARVGAFYLSSYMLELCLVLIFMHIFVGNHSFCEFMSASCPKGINYFTKIFPNPPKLVKKKPTMETIKHQRKNLNMLRDGKGFHDHGLVGLMLWKWPQHPKQSIDAVQMATKKFMAILHTNWKKKTLKFIPKHKDPE